MKKFKARYKENLARKSSTTTSPRARKPPIKEVDLKEKSPESMKVKEQENFDLAALLKNEADISSWMNLESVKKLGKDDKDGKDGSIVNDKEILLKRMKEPMEQDSKVNVIFKSRPHGFKLGW